MPESSRLICQGSPSKTHQRITLTPFALALAKPSLSVLRFSGLLTPSFVPPPKSRPQFSHGTFAPFKYQSWPCQEIREPALSVWRGVTPVPAAIGRTATDGLLSGKLACGMTSVGRPSGRCGTRIGTGLRAATARGATVAVGSAVGSRAGVGVARATGDAGPAPGPAAGTGGSLGVVDPMSQAES